MSVTRQIKLVDLYKSLTGPKTGAGGGSGGGNTSNSGGPPKPGVVEKTTYRKTKDDTYQEELARRRAEKQAEARHLDNLKAHPAGRGTPPVLLVDGYNVCGCDEGAAAGLGLKELFVAGELEGAQRRLVDELDNLAHHKGYRVICVFDADRAGGLGRTDQIDKTPAGVWVVFSVTNDADSWIERASMVELRGECSIDASNATKGRGATFGSRATSGPFGSGDEGGNGRGAGGDDDGFGRGSASRVVYVATNDGALSSIARGNGAYVISAGSLVEEMTRAREAETEILNDLAVKAKWGGELRGMAMVTKNSSTAEKLMAMYLSAPNASTTKHTLGANGAGFSSRPKKGKKNKGSSKPGGGTGGSGDGGGGGGSSSGSSAEAEEGEEEEGEEDDA